MDCAGGAEIEEDRYLHVTVTRHRTGVAWIVRLEGELEADTVPTLRRHLATLLRRPGAAIVFDLARLRFLSSAGVGALVEARSKDASRGATTLFVNMSTSIRRVLYVMGAIPLDTVFPSTQALEIHLGKLAPTLAAASKSTAAPGSV